MNPTHQVHDSIKYHSMMTPSHTIRLHAAWKRVVAEPEGSAGESLSVSLPDASLAECADRGVIYRRSFNRPTGIGSRTAVFLSSGLLPLASSARLNGQLLEPLGSAQVEITSLLLAHNELLVLLQRDAYLAASQASACLQIVEPT